MLLPGIVFLQAVTNYIEGVDLDIGSDGRAEPDRIVEEVKPHFCSFAMALLTLFGCISSGIDWLDVSTVLMDISVLVPI